MSAIVGILHRDGKPVEPQRLQAMVDILKHRGSDWAQAWHEGPVGLGNRMLWNTKHSCLEQMPSWDADRNTIITADCRLDNREELWRKLECEGYPLDKMTDSALTLRAYAKWGEDCAIHLLGDFAFAIWDKQQKRIFCARDHMGVKPFYYYLSDKRFAFSSEIKGIMQLEGVDRGLDDNWVADYLTVKHSWHEKRHTVYRSIRRLEPAHTLLLDEHGIRMLRYWKLDPSRKVHHASDEEYFEEFRSIFFEAVRCRMESIYPIGSKLSGGLDSSSITCVARSLSGSEKKIHSFSGVFPSIPQCDESPYINTVLDQGGLQAHCIDSSVVGTYHDYERKLWHLDQPQVGGGANHMAWFLLGHEKDSGVRVMLDGTDGDTVVSHGHGYIQDMVREGSWKYLLSELRALGKMHNQPVMRDFLFGYCRSQLRKRIPERIKKIRRGMRSFSPANDQSSPTVNQDMDMFRPEFISSVGLKERWKEMSGKERYTTAREKHWKDLSSGNHAMVLDLLEHFGASFGLEYRFPFYDRRLMEYCLAVPTRMKIRRGLGRYIMRESLKDTLPTQIAERAGKTDFTEMIRLSLKNHDADYMRRHMDRLLESISDYVDPLFMRDKYIKWKNHALDRHELQSFRVSLGLGLWMMMNRA